MMKTRWAVYKSGTVTESGAEGEHQLIEAKDEKEKAVDFVNGLEYPWKHFIVQESYSEFWKEWEGIEGTEVYF